MLILKTVYKHKPLPAMDKYQEKLNGICRTCRKPIKLGHRYVNKKVKDTRQILRLFSYDIENDVATIHPKYICKNCRRKLDMVKRIVRGNWLKQKLHLSSYIATTLGFV